MVMTQKIAFVASDAESAQDALVQLTARYGQVDAQDADIIVALGGDGFMLQTLHATQDIPAPVYGMNRGTVGFMMNAFDVILENEDYTLGKSIEYALHDIFYKQADYLGFVGFRKEHPHDLHSIIRLSFKEQNTDKNVVNSTIKSACEQLQLVFKGFRDQL